MIEGHPLLKAPRRNFEGSPDRLPPALTQTRAFRVHPMGTLHDRSAQYLHRYSWGTDTLFPVDLTDDGPDETRQFAGDRGAGLHFHLAPNQVRLIAVTKKLLRFPGDGLHTSDAFSALR